ncbi:DUF1211 domain-containing protein, partial [Candidatus Micrarchaeota archaeon]|nr:DUF1211 domain-containing protein [Candidatus Micrarchaeota archaeon]
MEEEGFFTGAKVLDLSDGIIAFSMTLLIATIAIPDPAQTPIEGLSSALWELKPKFLVCIFSFIIIALYWSNHHRIFQEIKKFDTTTVWLNMLFLLSIVIMPFTAALFGEYEDQQLTMMLFA